MHVVQNRSLPAYDGARFDVDGFCTLHSDVRLCRPSDDGKYKIVRKMCFKCGSATLARHMHSRGNRRMTLSSRDVPNEAVESRGRRRRTTLSRVVQSEVLAAGDVNKTERRQPTTAERRSSQDLAARTKRSPPLDRKGNSRRIRRNSLSLRPKSPPTSQNRRSSVSMVTSTKVAADLVPQPKTSEGVPSGKLGQCSGVATNKSNKCSQAPGRKGESRRTRRHSISLFSTPSLMASQNRPPAMLEKAKKKVTNEKIKELMYLMPSPGTSSKDGPSKSSVPFDGNGHCRAHPEVCLAKKKPDGGGWEIVSGVCPQCCVSAVLACQQRRPLVENNKPELAEKSYPGDAKELIGKVLTMRSCASDETCLTTESSSNSGTAGFMPRPAFSVDYFSSTDRDILGLALDLERSERMVLNRQPPGRHVSKL